MAMISLMVVSGERVNLKTGMFQLMGLKWMLSVFLFRFLRSRTWMMPLSVSVMGIL